MDLKKQLNVRIPEALHSRIEKADISKTQLVISAIELYFEAIEPDDRPEAKDDFLQDSLIEELINQIHIKDRQIEQANMLLGTYATHRQLIAIPEDPTKAIKARPWWRFW